MLQYAGVLSYPNVTYDGISLQPLLEQEIASLLGNRCLYHWREQDLYAIRCGPLKAHFVTRSGFDFSDTGTKHDPPLVFNIDQDPAENFALEVGSGLTQAELDNLVEMANEHVNEMEENKVASKYLAQDVMAMPCCSRSDSKNVNEIPRIWRHCTCDRI